MKRDCNQCGDFEYCAYDYKNCTGFIPGDNYTFEKFYEGMEEITVFEFIQYEEEFFKKNTEYLNKKANINRKENSGEINEKTAKQLRKNLEEEYKQYKDIYETTKYCIISDSLKIAYEATGHEISKNFRQFLDEQKKYAGKHVTMNSGASGILLGIGVALDDFYYIIKEDNTEIIMFDTGVDGIKKVEL